MANRWGYWEFAGGRFSPRELQYAESESLPDVSLRAGMPASPGSQFGLADQGFMVEVYALPDEPSGRHRYVVDVNVDGCGERVVVQSLPDLIELLAKLAPMVNVSLGMSGIATGRE